MAPEPTGSHVAEQTLPGGTLQCRVPVGMNVVVGQDGNGSRFHFLSSQKVATRPKESHVAKALRRLTLRQKSRLQCELYFTFKPEASEIKLSELDLRA